MKEKYKILVVNRDEKFLEKIEKERKAGQYVYEIAKTAAFASEKIKSDKYHIVLIDIDLPDKNGLELLKEIKDYDSLAQIIMTTEQSTMDKILSSLDIGANDYIADPYLNFEELMKMIDYSVEKLERWKKSIIDLIK